MCRKIGVPRSLVYYKKRERKVNSRLENEIIRIFKESRNNYGSPKIKSELLKVGLIVSKRKICEIMHKYGLVSSYTVKQFKVHKSSCNEDKIENKVDRKFDNREDLEVVVSDLTYVRVKDRWCYICLLLNLFNREIVGFSAGSKKNAELVYEAFLNSSIDLSRVKIFHTDRGNEFKNKLIDDVLRAFNIERSLSHKGTPYDNAVAEATYKIVKTEFAFNRVFVSLDELRLELSDYVNWFNTKRIHGSLNYLSPVEYRNILAI